MKRLVVILMLLVSTGYLVGEYQRSEIVGSPFKYAFVQADSRGNVKYISVDPQEKQIYVLSYPQNLEIKSRSVGAYQIGKLYTLGTYEGNPGEFVRKKVQGFMRAPVSGYLISERDFRRGIMASVVSGKGNTFTRMDSLLLYLRTLSYTVLEEGEEQLVRSGAITKSGEFYEYAPERLQQYLSTRIFDWGIGGTGVTAAVINQSGEDGLGRDIGQFLTNAGVDVVLVRGEESAQEITKLVITKEDSGAQQLVHVLETWFAWKDRVEGDTSQQRARVVIYVGRDALKLF